MARRAAPAKARPAASRPAETPPLARTKVKVAADRPRTVEQRIDELERELAEARIRISDLESRQRQIADRIAWALDSLRDLMEDES